MQKKAYLAPLVEQIIQANDLADLPTLLKNPEADYYLVYNKLCRLFFKYIDTTFTIYIIGAEFHPVAETPGDVFDTPSFSTATFTEAELNS